MEVLNDLKWDDVFKLKKIGEKKRVEFKTTDFLKDKNEIACQLTSFANRYGGKILVGIKDNEELQGWDALEGAKINRDKTLQTITNIAEDKCSPTINFSSDFLTSEKGNVLVINVERRKDIPHAIIERTGAEIKKRLYYIRTESGKKLVDDITLDYMFKNLEDPKFEYKFTIGIHYRRDSLDFAVLQSTPPYSCIWELLSFMHGLTKENKQFLKEKEHDRLPTFFLEVLPYAMLNFLSDHFPSWSVDIERRGNIKTTSPVKGVPKREIKLEDVPFPSETSLLSKLSFDIKSIFKKRRLIVPPETEVKIFLPETQTPYSSKLQLICDNSFNFDFSFHSGSWMAGVGGLAPYYGIIDPLKEFDKLLDLRKVVAILSIMVDLKFSFAFPDVDVPLFTELYRWGQNIIDSIKEVWDWESYTRKLPAPNLLHIETYLKKILEILEKKG